MAASPVIRLGVTGKPLPRYLDDIRDVCSTEDFFFGDFTDTADFVDFAYFIDFADSTDSANFADFC